MNVTPENVEPQPLQVAADEELRQRVCRYLAHSGHYPVRTLDVCATNGIVILRGTVPTYYVRQLAIACAQRVAGVRSVVDEIQIDLPAKTTDRSGRRAR